MTIKITIDTPRPVNVEVTERIRDPDTAALKLIQFIKGLGAEDSLVDENHDEEQELIRNGGAV